MSHYEGYAPKLAIHGMHACKDALSISNLVFKGCNLASISKAWLINSFWVGEHGLLGLRQRISCSCNVTLGRGDYSGLNWITVSVLSFLISELPHPLRIETLQHKSLNSVSGSSSITLLPAWMNSENNKDNANSKPNAWVGTLEIIMEWDLYWSDFGKDLVLIGYFEDSNIETLFLHLLKNTIS